MQTLKLKPTYKVVKAYYQELRDLTQLRLFSEGAVSPAFAGLLRYCARQFDWSLAEQFSMKRNRHSIRVDGALLDPFKLIHGVWEAKDTDDDLEREIKKKFDAGYPKANTLFQAPDRAIIWQDGYQVLDTDISRPPALVETLQVFFHYRPPEYDQWERAVEEFKQAVPQLAHGLLDLIRAEARTNRRFIQALEDFAVLCRQAINPNLSDQAIEEMLIQHLLTERIFRKVFDNPDFAERNIIAREIETVIQALTSQSFSRHDFLRPLDRFYGAIETTAATIDDYSQKQAFLNTVYEKFFQGFSVKVADTHGIVYTPQPVVDFMVRSVEHILAQEFGRSLGDPGVHILDPFVGTGNFITRVMREIPRIRLADKYAGELHCNEVMLLPYYIAAMNIEHEYFALTGQYRPFEGICLVDTFELAEERQLSLFTQANTERVEAQKQTPIFVIIGNPPYNAGQVNENDNNKNRRYPVVDRRVSETYARDSKATLLRKLSDPYVKAIRWASDRIGDEGVVALITNSSFVSDISFDGMRKHLAQDFNRIYILDLKGNVRKDSMREGIPIGEEHTVFGLAAMVGISITFFVRSARCKDRRIYYSAVDWRATRQEKFDLMEKAGAIGRLEWTELTPDKKCNWLTEGLSEEFETFIPMGTKAAKSSKTTEVETIFKLFSLGVATNRDDWVYDFREDSLAGKVKKLIQNYNYEVFRLSQESEIDSIDSFVNSDPGFVKWTDRLKKALQQHQTLAFDPAKVRRSMYRPFAQQVLYFDHLLNQRRYRQPTIFPTPETEAENHMICVAGPGNRKGFGCLMTNLIPSLDLAFEKTQCFPFYTYDQDGTNRQENITDWALAQFRAHYGDDAISKWDIFHYVYGLLHHPAYREKYAANLRRELPRIPFAPDPSTSLRAGFWPFAEAGARLAELHVNYEDQPEYPLQRIENPDARLDWRVEKMRLSRDKTQLAYNDFLTLAGIPPEAFEYRLGNRSALHWIIDRYQVKTDRRSGIVNDPNRPGDPQYIVRLIGKVITVSLETVKIVEGLPELE